MKFMIWTFINKITNSVSNGAESKKFACTFWLHEEWVETAGWRACKYMILREKLLIKNKIEFFSWLLTNLSSPVSCSCYRYVMDFLLRKILWFKLQTTAKNAHFCTPMHIET